MARPCAISSWNMPPGWGDRSCGMCRAGVMSSLTARHLFSSGCAALVQQRRCQSSDQLVPTLTPTPDAPIPDIFRGRGDALPRPLSSPAHRRREQRELLHDRAHPTGEHAVRCRRSTRLLGLDPPAARPCDPAGAPARSRPAPALVPRAPGGRGHRDVRQREQLVRQRRRGPVHVFGHHAHRLVPVPRAVRLDTPSTRGGQVATEWRRVRS